MSEPVLPCVNTEEPEITKQAKQALREIKHANEQIELQSQYPKRDAQLARQK